MTAVRSLIRSCYRKNNDTYKLVTFLTGKLYNEVLSETDNEFYFWDHESKTEPSLIPDNFIPIRDLDLPICYDVDAVLCHDYGTQYKICKKFSDFWHLPLIMCFHSIKNPEQFLINGDINIYDSVEIQESWQGLGAIITPGVDENFTKVNIKTDSNIILCDIQSEEDIQICKEIVKQTPYTIKSLAINKYERYEQYKDAICLLQLKPKQFPIEILESSKVGLNIISVQNDNLKNYIEDYNENTYNSITQIKGAIMRLSKVKPNMVKTKIKSNIEFKNDFNKALEFINDFIYIRN